MFPDSEVGGTVQPCPFTKPVPTHWIEIELIDEDNAPVPLIRYRVKLPNSEIVHGYLDKHGRARIETIPGGTCEVTFPELDKEAWARV
ncbi:MAG TPA: hypothetical protein VG456_06545 [Candidatus Sulfopaludibacter sp.]|jgi:hypothetical protein|nr:hypothetical protein [Candidatus Sulfopaludibacter sp.]